MKLDEIRKSKPLKRNRPSLVPYPPDVYKVGDSIVLTNQPIQTLEGYCPKYVKGSVYCENTWITSLKGAPDVVDGNFLCQKSSQLVSIEGIPKRIGKTFSCSLTGVKSLHNIHKQLYYVGECFYCGTVGGPCTHLLGLCLISGIKYVFCGSEKINRLFNQHRHDIIEFQDALIDAGYEEQAKL